MVDFCQIDRKEMDYNETRHGFNDWSYKPGVYLMIFPNGMKYLGKSNHVGKRLVAHISKFKKGEGWYGAARPSFCSIKDPSFFQLWENFRNKVDFFVAFSEKENEEIEMEELYLKRIKMNFRTKEYYNSVYPSVSIEEWTDWMFGSDQNG